MTQIYKNTDNAHDILIKNKDNIVHILHLIETGQIGQAQQIIDAIKPKLYTSQNDFETKSKDGELGYIRTDSGQTTLLMHLPNGVIGVWPNDEQNKEFIAKVKAELKSLIDANKGLIDVNKASIDAMSGGVKIYHFATINDANSATTTFNESDIAWIGTTGAWTGYHYTNGSWVSNGTTSTHQATIDAYTKAETQAELEKKQDKLSVAQLAILSGMKYTHIEKDKVLHLPNNTLQELKKYALKTYDFSSTEQGLTFNETGGKRYQIIAKPADESAPIGTDIILNPKVVATDPSQIPADADQITYGTDLLWIDKSATNIMTWDEIKLHVNNHEKMVIKKLEDGHYQLVRWIKPDQPENIFQEIDGTIFNGHPVDWEYDVPNGLKIYTDFEFTSTDQADINKARIFQVDLSKKSQWEDFGKILEQGYGNGVEFHLFGYHDADGGISKYKLSDVDNVGNAYYAFATSKVVVKGIATNKLENKNIINPIILNNSQIIDLTQYTKANDLFAIFEKLSYGTIVRLDRGNNAIFIAILGKKTNGKYHPDDTTNVDFYELSSISSVPFIDIFTFKVPNQDIAWTTGVGGESPVNLGVGQNSNILIAENAKGLIIGSSTWVDADGKGIIKHGTKSATFEEIIAKAKETPASNPLTKTLTLEYDDGTTEDIKVG